MPIRAILRSFGHRNFRLFFAGQGLSLIGTWMQQTALPWLVYRQTDSPMWLAAVSFAGQFPAAFFTPIAGVFADRWNRRRVLLVTQTLAMAQAFVLAGMAATGRGGPWVLFTLNAVLSVVNAFDLTARQSFLHEMLDSKDDLGNAIALNSAIFNSARLIGPWIAVRLSQHTGEAGCFFVNGCSFLAVLLSLLAMRVPPRPRADAGPPWQGLREGVAYAAGSYAVRTILLLVAIVCLFAVPYNVLLPVIVRERLQGGEQLYGDLLAASGLGALAGGLFLASRKSVVGLLRGVALAPALVGACLLAVSLNDSAVAAFPLLFLTGLSVVALLTICNTVLQTTVDDRLRGRLISIYALTFMGLAPLGSLVSGYLTRELGLLAALRINGAALLVGAAVFGLALARPLRDRVREAYRRKSQPEPLPELPGEPDA